MPAAATRHRRTHLAATALLGLVALTGCAGTRHIVVDRAALDGQPKPEAWNGSITVASDPTGATCTVTRDGAQVARITAPAQVQLARGNSPAEVRCSAPGRMETAVTLRPLRDFGVHHHQPTGPNGVVGNAEDIRTGRVRRFFDTTVALPPASFATAAERDAWFAARAEAVRRFWAVQIGRAERSQEAMIDSADTLRGYMNADLAALESQKAASQVGAARRR